ncbi:hypothetical protein F5884DRAFT_903033 [Xylogone sp. PMI_703]|nr:hypothetical protein F5884DRAFT_903033 [Xylogone sp. PMI_703]
MSKSFILITGSTGMVGFSVLLLALQTGYRVRAAVRNQAGFDKIRSNPLVKLYVHNLESFIVPDITVPGAYDEAVKGVEYIIHVASPLALPHITDFENELIKPALQGTVGMLESAHKVTGIKRIVITTSVAAVVPISPAHGSEDVTYNEKSRAPSPTGPYQNVLEAYYASKILALNATEDFVKEKQPAYDVINIGPGYIVGRDNTVTDVSNITKGTNGVAIGHILGQPSPFPINSVMIHLEDVAKLHVQALNPAIKGNQYFMATAHSPDGVEWGSVVEIVKRRYPKEAAEGLFKLDAPLSTDWVKSDSSHTEKTFGFKFKTFEEAIVSVVDHYLELAGKK